MQGLPQTVNQSGSQRESHVGSQMSRQGHLIEKLSSGMDSLESRLSSILRGIPPSPSQPSNKEPKAVLVGHAEAISNQNDQLEHAVEQLFQILERLEL
jgi:hypothetical protein